MFMHLLLRRYRIWKVKKNKRICLVRTRLKIDMGFSRFLRKLGTRRLKYLADNKWQKRFVESVDHAHVGIIGAPLIYGQVRHFYFRISPWYQCVVSLIFLANATINLMFWKTYCVQLNKEISFKHFSVLNFNSFTLLCEWFAFFQMLPFSLLGTLRWSPLFTVW